MNDFKLRLLILLFLLPVFLKSQEATHRIGIGLNLPPLIGNTIALDVECTNNKHFSLTFGIGGMLKNQLQGTLYKIGESTNDHESSGVYSSFGIRYLPGKTTQRIRFFAGTKLIGGYFKQSATFEKPFEAWFRNGQIPKDYYFVDDRVYSEGFFAAIAIESGINLRLTDRLHSEFGIQGGYNFYKSKRMVSKISSILPGLGALNIVGILKIKYLILKN
ncbi:MAG: hypothetical protein HOO86_03435 [Bacteroidales bacterium]|nr:hypothetical protein [Bacteroidales bacterium]